MEVQPVLCRERLYLISIHTFTLSFLPVVPDNFDYDPTSKGRTDRTSKPELTNMAYEFLAPMEYMTRSPQPPSFVFLIDVSFAAVTSGTLPPLIPDLPLFSFFV